MLPRIPRLRQDELLYSWVSRMGVRMLPRHRQDLVRLLWGDENRRSKIDFPLRLEFLAQRTEGVLGDGMDLLYKATLFPLYALVLSPERSDAVAEGMIDAKGVGAAKVRGLTPLRLRTPPSLRFCPECWRADDANKIERYWRRTHQCPGVFVCHAHGCALFYSEVRWAGREGVQEFFPAAKVKEGRGRIIRLSGEELSACHSIAIGSHWLLNHNHLFPGPYRLSGAYREGFRTKGLVRPGGFVCGDLVHFVAGKVGQTLMKAATWSQGWSREWPILMLRGSRANRYSNSPLQHLILMNALGYRAEGFLKAMDKPSLLDKALSQVKLRPVRVKSPKPVPVCQLRSAEIASWWSDPAVSVTDMAKRLGVATGTVTLHASRIGLSFPRKGLRGNTWSKFGPVVPRDKEAERDARRRAFMEYQSRFPLMTQTEMLRAGKANVNWLQRNDREWLRAHRTVPVQKGGAPGIDWEKRDSAFAKRIPEIAARLAQNNKKVSFASVGRELGMCLVNIHRRLPKTSQRLVHVKSEARRHCLEKPKRIVVS